MFDGGRKPSVGDCALFQAGNAPPFIGILRRLIPEKDTAKYAVNWLYRPADVKLAKGGPLEAAPNEIFYSFHKDEISAASLLHPCKVAFLRKGVELPQGVSHYVCRRVYDTAHKCLWWLSDRDYTDEHQEEVDQLLERTKLEMQAAVQSGGPSPRALISGPASSQAVKSASEALQNATFSTSNKSKKRERVEKILEPSKRERSAKSEDGELSPLKRDRTMKFEELSSITDKDGGLLNPGSVERLVQLMQQDRNDGGRKIVDVGSRRTVLAGVVAATEKDDCLSKFVQLGGLPLLDDWLQEAHKGKVGDGGSPKEGDKGVEELLLTLLKALDKLPVDLDALKTCSVGKSVNHLRGHKNPDIQKKARKLVEIWKKRVDAEMKLSGEVKAGSSHLWSSYKQNSPDILHSHLMKGGGPTEVAVKSSGAYAGSAKPMQIGPLTADGVSKGSSVTPGKMSSMLVAASPPVKRDDSNTSKLTNVLSGEIPGASKEEKSVTPGAAQNNGQMWGNGLQGKGAGGSSWKEDVKNASMGGTISSKAIGAGSRHPNLQGKGLLGSNLTGSSKDLLGGKPLVWSRSPGTDKLPAPATTTAEKGSGDATRDNANSQHNTRLIVRIPNPGRSPARVSTGGSFEQAQPGGHRPMSGIVPERTSSANVDNSDGKNRIQNGTPAVTSSDAGGDGKGAVSGRHGHGTEEEREKLSKCGHPLDSSLDSEKRSPESMKVDFERSAKEAGEQNGRPGTFSQRSGATESTIGGEEVKKGDLSAGTAAIHSDAFNSEVVAMDVDQLGISLLASVAASEMKRSVANESAQDRPQVEDANAEQVRQPRGPDGTASMLPEVAGNTLVESMETSHHGDRTDANNAQDQTGGSGITNVEQRAGDNIVPAGKSVETESKKEGQQDLQASVLDGEAKVGEKRSAPHESGLGLGSSGIAGSTRSASERNAEERLKEEAAFESATGGTGAGSPFGKDMKLSTIDGSTLGVDGLSSSSKNVKKDATDERKTPFPCVATQGKGVELCNGYGSPASELKGGAQGNASVVVSPEKQDRGNSTRSAVQGDVEVDHRAKAASVSSERNVSAAVSEAMEAALDGALELKRNRPMEGRGMIGRVPSFHSPPLLGVPNRGSPPPASVPLQQGIVASRPLPGGEPSTPEQATETTQANDEKAVGGSDGSERRDFDLNEGFCEPAMDESIGSHLQPTALSAASSHASSSLPAGAVSVVTAHKGGFVLITSPVRTKSELGWKGSAATSAFRPAEPRRTPDRQPSAGETLTLEFSTVGASKISRPPLDLNIDLNVVDDRSFDDVGMNSSAAPSSTISGPSSGGAMSQAFMANIPASVGLSFTTGNPISAQPAHPPPANPPSARPFLDLNILDDSEEAGAGSAMEGVADSRTQMIISPPPAAVQNAGSLQPATRRASVVLDFDLNDGPSVEDGLLEDQQLQPALQAPISRNSSVTGTSMISPAHAPVLHGRGVPPPEVVATTSSWFGPTTSFKPPAGSVAMPPEFSSSRTDSRYSQAAAAAAQSYLSAGAGGAPFNSDLYRTTVTFSSPPPTGFPPNVQAPYPYGGFSVAAGYPFPPPGGFVPNTAVAPYLDSSVAVNIRMATAGMGGPVATAHLPRPMPPYVVGLPDVGVGAPEPAAVGGGWPARPSLDLNCGPEPVDGETVREDVMGIRPPTALHGVQQPGPEQMRNVYSGRQVMNAAGGPMMGVAPSLKRKEPDSGWEMNRSGGFKQHAWQ